MTNLEGLDMLKTLLDLGLTGILLYFLLIVWNDRKQIVAEKDRGIKDLNDKVLDIVRENTKTQADLRSSIQENTRATESLTLRIYDALKK